MYDQPVILSHIYTSWTFGGFLMNYRLPINTIKEQIEAKLQHNFGLTLENATDDQCYKAVVLVVRDLMVKGYLEFKKRAEETHTKRVYYLCM